MKMALSEKIISKLLAAGVLGLSVASTGCTQMGNAKSSLLPESMFGTKDKGVAIDPAGIPDLSGEARGVKGQFATMGSAFSSAYEKTKSAITSPFAPKVSSTDPVSLSSGIPTIGPELLVSLGQLSQSQGQYAKALDNYSKALEIDRNNIPALTATARLYDRQNDFDQSVTFYKKAIDVSGSDASLLSELGDVDQRSGRLDEAKKQFQAAINLDPTEAKYRTAMASILIDQGQKEEAMAELAQVEKPAMSNYRMAYLMVSKQNMLEAQTYLSQALAIDPNLAPARTLMDQISNSQIASSATRLYQSGAQVAGTVNHLLNTNPSSLGQPSSAVSTASGVTSSTQPRLQTANSNTAYPVPIMK